MASEHQFGGDWTDEKLRRVGMYLKAYTTALKHQSFNTTYVDAFAGTGYRSGTVGTAQEAQLFAEPTDEGPSRFREGSALIALKTDPSFDKYVFLEKQRERSKALAQLEDQFPHLRDRIEIHREDCNPFLRRWCCNLLPRDRAVVFLDPYGMQVEWRTLEAIASSKVVDLWILFPHAVGVNRMLRGDGKLPDSWRRRLNAIFGTEDWFEAFYRQPRQTNLWEDEEEREKVATAELVGEYFVKRLRGIFPGVARRTLTLQNSKGTPLYLLCFACANPEDKARSLALRIAGHILRESCGSALADDQEEEERGT